MKKLLLILLCLPMIGFGQQTYVPDDNFEDALEYMGIGNGIPNDNYVTTANISDVDVLFIFDLNISDLTGIEDFTDLEYLRVQGNQLTSIDLSNNTALISLLIMDNQLSQLDLSNNPDVILLRCNNNPNLTCISIYDLATTNGWKPGHVTIDYDQYFSESCMSSDISETYQNRKLLRVVDLFGREVINYNQAVFFIYDDGTVERKVIIKP
jgi:Leucine-rich repeat (LRR) protein